METNIKDRIAGIVAKGCSKGTVAALADIWPEELSHLLAGHKFSAAKRARVLTVIADIELILRTFGVVPLRLDDVNEVRRLIAEAKNKEGFSEAVRQVAQPPESNEGISEP